MEQIQPLTPLKLAMEIGELKHRLDVLEREITEIETKRAQQQQISQAEKK